MTLASKVTTVNVMRESPEEPAEPKCITFIRNISSCYEKDLYSKLIILNNKKLKHRAFHLRLLIDSIENSEVKEQAIKEYVRLIQQINGNN